MTIYPQKFYVYHWLRSDGTPYYIGKGTGDRAYQKTRTMCSSPSDPARIILIAENLTEEDAFWLEMEEIAKYGRRCDGTGILYNLTLGGEGASGYRHKSETKRIIAEQKKGENNPNWGGLKPGHAEKISSTMKGTRIGENNPMHGRSHSEETRKKMIEKAKLRKRAWCVDTEGKSHLVNPDTFVLPPGWIKGRMNKNMKVLDTTESLEALF